jgi:predicted dehydrogenase
MGLAAGMLPRVEAQTGGKKIGYCVIGLGEIARHFMPGVRQSQHSQITGLVSGHRDKAERIAAEYGVPKTSIYGYEDLERIRDNKEIDAVYVALPNSMHAEYTIRSAKAGKHVFCEKPMATSVADAEAMIAACRAANVKLMIGYRCHYEALNLEAMRLIRSGAIGQVQTVESGFGFNAGKGIWRLNKALAGGGPLMDVGIYSLNATRYLTGEEPVELKGEVSTIDKDGRFDTVEENVSWAAKFPSGVVASCATTYGANLEGFFKVQGSKGWITMEPAFSYEGLKLQARYATESGGPPTLVNRVSEYKDPQQFTWEADHFSQCVAGNRQPDTPGEEGLRDMKYMAEIYRTAGTKTLG